MFGYGDSHVEIPGSVPPPAASVPPRNDRGLTLALSCIIISYMRRDNRLSATLHALLHMAEQNRPMTSAELAMCMTTNAVVVRRTMAGLREAGLVRSEKGHGGGWEIARDLATVTLKDIYDALGKPSLMAMGIHLESPTCLVEQAVNHSLTSAFAEAEAVLIGRLADVTLAQLAADFHARALNHYGKIQSKIRGKTK